MALSKPRPSDDAASLVQTHINEKTQAHKLYVLELKDIVDKVKPTEKHLAGWRFLTDIAPDMAFAADISQREPSQPPSFANLSYGPQLAKLASDARKIETWPQLPAGEYELSLLSVPGLLIESFWLREPARDGLVIPYDSPIRELAEWQIFQTGQFLETLYSFALKRLKDLENLWSPGNQGSLGSRD